MKLSDNANDLVKKYLNKFGSDKWIISNDKDRFYDNIIVIPSLAEFELLPECLGSLESNDSKLLSNTLVLVVVNNSVNATEEIKSNNIKTIKFLEKYSGKLNLSFVNAASSTNAINDKFAGVGYARKIGCDLALKKFDYSSDRKKIILFLDADCVVSPDYLSIVTEEFYTKNLHSAVIEYEHRFVENSPEAEAIICYEIFLRYHKLELKYANSYYDYHTIGSTIVCDAEYYIKVGGMNKRKAGEDYYFLEKLAKLNKIYTIAEALVFPSSRKSWRVPFGTGQRISRHLSYKQNEFVGYNPKSFQILKRWLKIFMKEKVFSTNQLLWEAENINPTLKDFLILNNFQNDWNQILKNNFSTKEIQKQKIFWFDAFRTLKLIHYLRDNGYPNINLFEAVDSILNKLKIKLPIKRDKSIPEIEIQNQYLLFLRKILKEKFSDDN